MEWTITGILLIIGLFDLWRITNNKDTLSQKIHSWFTGKLRWVDYMILVVILALIWIIFGQFTFNRIMIGTIIGHLFWNEE